MNVLLCIHSLSTGGAERQVIQDCKLLAHNGHSVSVALVLKGEIASLLSSNVDVHILKEGNEFRTSRKLAMIIEEVQADVLISHLYWANKVCGMAALKTGVRFYAFEHGLGANKKWYHQLWIKFYSRAAKEVITCSDASMRTRIKNHGLNQSKFKVIHNSFEPSLGEIKRDERGSKPFTIGFVGRLAKVKQLFVLKEVAQILEEKNKSYRFLIIGSGEEEKKIKSEIQVEGLDCKFDFLGFVTNPERFYDEMDCFILPSKSEDFSLALIEASNAGLPCLAFNVGGNGEIIQDGVTGFIVHKYSSSQLAAKVIWLMENLEISKEMGKAAHAFVNKSFTTGHREKQLLELLSID